MTSIYLCVNYKSATVLEKTLQTWKKNCDDLQVYVVDNYSDMDERNNIDEVCKKNSACCIHSENIGYGGGLNIGIERILQDYPLDTTEKSIKVFFGNADVEPLHKIDPSLQSGIPILNIYCKRKNQNPFLNRFHVKFLFILCLAAKLKSRTLYYSWHLLYKFFKLIPSKPVAVHGSLFCLELEDLRKIHPVFNQNVFLYCEELFFYKKIKRLKKDFVGTNMSFVHIGSVSTEGTIKKDKNKFFLNWVKSMRLFCNENN